MKGESWNTISDSLTLVLSILISIHHSDLKEPFQPTNLYNRKLGSISKFDIDCSIRIGNGREIFSIQCLRYFTLSSTLPRIVSTFTRASLSIPLSSIEKRGEQVRAQVHLSFTSVIWRSVRLRESTIAWNRAPIAIPVEKRLTSVLVLYTLENCVYIYIRVFVKEKIWRDNLASTPPPDK